METESVLDDPVMRRRAAECLELEDLDELLAEARTSYSYLGDVLVIVWTEIPSALIEKLATTLERASDAIEALNELEPANRTIPMVRVIEDPPMVVQVVIQPETLYSPEILSRLERADLKEADAAPVGPGGDFLIPSPRHYYALQRALAQGRFTKSPASPFPRAVLYGGGHAELRQIPPDQQSALSPTEVEGLVNAMWTQLSQLSDQDVDTLDLVSHIWMRHARSPSDRVAINIDDLIGSRGVQRKKSGKWRGGYETEYREAALMSLVRLGNLWLEIRDPRNEKKVLQSRAFVITDRMGQRRVDGSMDVTTVLVTPGIALGSFLLGPGRQVSQLSAKALSYDPMRQSAEKRLARYLAWQWRCGASGGAFVRSFRVRGLILKEIGLNVSRPQRGLERFEDALDRLQEDGVIAAWQYEDWDGPPTRQGWLDRWLDAKVIIEAPDLVRTAYQRLDKRVAPQAALPEDLPSRLRARRRALGISQMQAAEQLEMSRPYYTQIETGRREPGPKLISKLDAWALG